MNRHLAFALVLCFFIPSVAMAQTVLPGDRSTQKPPVTGLSYGAVTLPRDHFTSVVPVIGGSVYCWEKLSDAEIIAKRSASKFCSCVSERSGATKTPKVNDYNCTPQTCERPGGGMGFYVTCEAYCTVSDSSVDPKREFEKLLDEIKAYMYIVSGSTFDEARKFVCKQN